MVEDIKFAFFLVFGERRYAIMAVALSILFFIIYISVPVFAMPGKSYTMFFSLIPPTELAVTTVLSGFMGVIVAMQVYAWRNNVHRIHHASAGIVGIISGSISLLLSTASCASCVSALFSFLGFAGVAFFIQHRAEMMILTFIIMGASLYFTSKRIAGKCSSCSISEPQKPVHGRKEQKSSK